MKAAREKKVLNLHGKTDRFAADLFTETWQVRKEWRDIFSVLNQNQNLDSILY